MKILDVYIQHAKNSLDRPFSYCYEGKEKVDFGYRVMVPFAHQNVMGFVTNVTESSLTLEQLSQANGFKMERISFIVDKEPLLSKELFDLAEEVSSYYLSPKISVLQAMLPASLRPSKSALKGPKIAYEKWVRAIDTNEEGLTDKQIEILRLISSNGEILKKEAGSLGVVDRLVKLGKVEVFLKERQRYQVKEYEKENPHELNIEQSKAYKEILDSDKSVVLLQGVTGSGKTEVYLHLSEHYLKQGKNILMLVPEISLTPIMVEYFERRFQGEVAILHSELTPGEKYDQYRRIASGNARVVVGARSAIFAPLSNIGLIILDEEHVESYKQDSSPFYHAREVAIMRAKRNGAKVVLGSATPSLETKARAVRGVYGYAKMEKRINKQALPKTTIIDIKDRSQMVKGNQIFSKFLFSEIKERIEKKEQVVLLINRRGYSSFLSCANCGYIFNCPSCHGNLTYHKEDNFLKCHHCDFVMQYPSSCPNCGSELIRKVGFGTERIEKILGEEMPEAACLRLDSDVGKVRNNIAKTLSIFRNKEADILIGTQMIAKGHDFPNVTLVGLVLADIGLSLPTYRASERTFQLIAQAVGRSGRGEKTGEAIIQTYNPNHYAISLAAKQDYESFFLKEMQERKISQYPPYVYLITMSVRCKNEERCIEASTQLKSQIDYQAFEGVQTIGPVTPFYSIQGEYHKRDILIKFKDPTFLKPFLASLSHSFAGKGGVDILYDVDPLDF